MLSIGLTGGIASGKSFVAAHLRELGATVIDADQLARDVVAPGTVGLARVLETFGPEVLNSTGALNRPVLGAIVFADTSKRAQLNAIVHPLVRARAAELKAAALGSIIVQDIPLLVETGQSADFNLVIVVQAPTEMRVMRMLENRGMTEEEALGRIEAQASDQQREAAADVVLENAGSPADILHQVDELWTTRLLPFAANLDAGRAVEPTPDPAALEGFRDRAAQERLLAQRVAIAAGELGLGVDRLGPIGAEATNVIELQLGVRSMDDADALVGDLAAAGFPRVEGAATQRRNERLHGTCDPGRPLNLHIRLSGPDMKRIYH